MVNERITKEQYASLLEILRAIQAEEREIEDREGESVGYWQELDSSLRGLQESIEGVRSLGREMKVVKRKLKMVKNEKRLAEAEVQERKAQLAGIEEFYQSEFAKLSQKLGELETGQQIEDPVAVMVSRIEFLQQRPPGSLEEACSEITQRLRDLRAEADRKDEEVQQLKFELDRQNNENEGEIAKFRKV